jgi:hypothetical protein
VTYLIVGLDRRSVAPWHDNIQAEDVATATQIASPAPRQRGSRSSSRPSSDPIRASCTTSLLSPRRRRRRPDQGRDTPSVARGVGSCATPAQCTPAMRTAQATETPTPPPCQASVKGAPRDMPAWDERGAWAPAPASRLLRASKQERVLHMVRGARIGCRPPLAPPVELPWAEDLYDRLWTHSASRSRTRRHGASPTRGALSAQQLRRLRVGSSGCGVGRTRSASVATNTKRWIPRGGWRDPY